jgi:hypothetical protein
MHADPHAAAATGIGLSLRPTEVLIFGNAKASTPLTQPVQEMAIDLAAGSAGLAGCFRRKTRCSRFQPATRA